MTARSLYWMTQDLRLEDNAALRYASQSQQLLCVYVVEEKWFSPSPWQTSPMGYKRWHFIQEAISDVNSQLKPYGQTLHVRFGDCAIQLSELCRRYHITELLCTRRAGVNEQQVIRTLQTQLPQLKIKQFDQYTLFSATSLPFNLHALPKSYSSFKRKVDTVPVAEPLDKPANLPPMPKSPPRAQLHRPAYLPHAKPDKVVFRGGEGAGRRHLHDYFTSTRPGHYKAKRNALDGWDNSSKLSPWLNQGCLSARQIRYAIKQYERDYGANDSSQWLYVELLWREYFQWLQHKIKHHLFSFKGLASSAPLTSFYAERFRKWCEGSTPYALVNACMHELQATGYMSNRGRQIVASCFVNELELDWRYGAAWFEHHLLDYDVAVNWGNWQYIAGVGVDPRGGRHFNLDKQRALYDPEGHFCAKWQGHCSLPLDSVDAADWPVLPTSPAKAR